MGSEINFNANDVPPQTPFEPVPNGKYRAHIVDSEVKPTKDGRGKYLQLEWEILDGEFKGRKLWDRLNIVNSSETAQKIGQSQLSAVCHATGMLKLGNSSQLHHIPVLIKVVVKQSPGYDPQNEVKGYEAIGGAAPAAAAPTAASNASPAAAAPAWAQKKSA
jgi:hypothetical protein